MNDGAGGTMHINGATGTTESSVWESFCCRVVVVVVVVAEPEDATTIPFGRSVFCFFTGGSSTDTSASTAATSSKKASKSSSSLSAMVDETMLYWPGRMIHSFVFVHFFPKHLTALGLGLF